MSENLSDEEVYIELRLWHDSLIPENITRLFGDLPSCSAKRGEYISSRVMPIDTGIWKYKKTIDYPWDINAGIDLMLKKFEDNVPFVSYYKKNRINIEIAIVMYLKRHTTIVIFPPTILERLSKLGIVLDFGMYI